MATKRARTVLDEVFVRSLPVVPASPNSGLFSPEHDLPLTLSELDLQPDVEEMSEQPTQRRRIFEVFSIDGRSLMALEADQ